MLNSKIPTSPFQSKWTTHKAKIKLVNPANKRRYHVIVVGTGLAGASAAASLSELGYNFIPGITLTYTRVKKYIEAKALIVKKTGLISNDANSKS